MHVRWKIISKIIKIFNIFVMVSISQEDAKESTEFPSLKMSEKSLDSRSIRDYFGKEPDSLFATIYTW